MFSLIDNNSLFIEATNDDTGIPLPDSNVVWYTPLWDGNVWTEAMPQEEISGINKLIRDDLLAIQEKNELDRLIVEVDGMIFSATEKSQVRMMLAINAAKVSGLTETGWILKDDDSPTLITLAQLKQAQSLAIQALGAIIVGNTGNG